MYIYRIMLFLVFGGYLLSPLFMDGWGDLVPPFCDLGRPDCPDAMA